MLGTLGHARGGPGPQHGQRYSGASSIHPRGVANYVCWPYKILRVSRLAVHVLALLEARNSSSRSMQPPAKTEHFARYLQSSVSSILITLKRP